eukprot:Gb_11172 [translate_table: standard]
MAAMSSASPALHRSFLKPPSDDHTPWDSLSSKYSLQMRRPLPILQSGILKASQKPTGLITACSSLCLPNSNLYEVLSVGQNVGLGEIKSAYRQMVRLYHPDVCPPAEREECSKMFIQIQEAYETLSDPSMRSDYDYRLTNPNAFDSDLPRGEMMTMQGGSWKEQLQNLKTRSACSSARNTWGTRMRHSRDQAQ